MIDDKKKYEICNIYNCSCNKKYTQFVVDFSYMKPIFFLFERTYFAVMERVKLWNKLFRFVHINPGPFCGSTFLVYLYFLTIQFRWYSDGYTPMDAEQWPR